MKKHLIALAALAATGAFAQSSVTVSGMLDIGWKNQEHTGTSGTGAKASGISDGAMGPNRLIFQGTEDMGGGLKANFMTEIGINPTNDELTGLRTGNSGIQYDQALNASSAASPVLHTGGTGLSQNTNRQTWVALAGGFGEFRAGYLVNNLYVASSQSGYNLTFEGLIGADVFHTHGNTAVGGTRGNGMQYTTPKMGGFSATLQYGTGNGRQTLETNNATTQDNLERTGLKLDYVQGGLNATYVFTSAKNKTQSSILNSNGQGETLTAPSNGDAVGTLGQLLVGYDFGAAKVTANFNNGSNGSGTDYRSQQVSVRVPFGKAALLASMGNLTTATAGANTADVKGHQFGVSYSFSKRTTGYAMMGRTEDTGTSASVWHAIRTSNIIGLNHSF